MPLMSPLTRLYQHIRGEISIKSIINMFFFPAFHLRESLASMLMHFTTVSVVVYLFAPLASEENGRKHTAGGGDRGDTRGAIRGILT